jgi:hypothetical protein
MVEYIGCRDQWISFPVVGGRNFHICLCRLINTSMNLSGDVYMHKSTFIYFSVTVHRLRLAGDILHETPIIFVHVDKYEYVQKQDFLIYVWTHSLCGFSS